MIVRLLLGEIPERTVFMQKGMEKALRPYFELTNVSDNFFFRASDNSHTLFYPGIGLCSTFFFSLNIFNWKWFSHYDYSKNPSTGLHNSAFLLESNRVFIMLNL